MKLLETRTITALILLPIVGLMIWLGGWYFNLFILFALGVCGWEWRQLFLRKGYHTSAFLLISGIILLVVTRLEFITVSFEIAILCILFAALIASMAQYSKGDDKAPLNYMILVSGILYIGFLGADFIKVRMLGNGAIWLAFFIANTSIGDTGAYLIGSRWGKHKFGNRISPNKSWEGYLGGIIFAFLFSAIFGLLCTDLLGADWLQIVLMGTVLYCVVPVGDFGISMFKRSVGMKHTSNLLPGHGGFMDRMDTHLWTVAIGVIWLEFVLNIL